MQVLQVFLLNDLQDVALNLVHILQVAIVLNTFINFLAQDLQDMCKI